jgi:hypothetical protein
MIKRLGDQESQPTGVIHPGPVVSFQWVPLDDAGD